jgi:putative transposase
MAQQDVAGVSAPHEEIDTLIARSYLAGTDTRRVGRALAALFRGSVSKHTVSRVWHKIKGDGEAGSACDLSLRTTRA